MSRPNPFQRHEPQGDESETVPLAADPLEEEWLEERDLGGEELPSYTEAVAQGASRRTAEQQASVSHVESPPSFEQMERERPTRRSQFDVPFSTERLQRMSFCLLTPTIALVAGCTFSGIHFVNTYSNPTPPGATPGDSVEDKEVFILWTIIVGLLAYPLLFLFLLFKFPRIFGLPWDAQSRRRAQSQEAQKKARRICIPVCSGLSILYFGVIAVTLWGVLHLANTRLQQQFASYCTEAWVGNFITLENTGMGSIGYLCFPNGTNLGNIVYMNTSTGWELKINGSPEGFDTITYINATNLSGTLFTATCQSPSSNGTSNACLSGTIPRPLGFTGDVVEYNTINMTIRANNSTVLNVSFDDSVGTTSQYYQGIGLNYAPLGLWFQGSSPLLQVLWSKNSTKACAGLRINFPKENEALAWPILGIIWEWWIQWGQDGGCSWSW